MDLEGIRYVLAKKATLVMFVAISLSTLVRPMLAELPVLLTYIGIINSCISGLLFLLLTYTKPRPYYVHLVIILGIAFIIPLLIITGGVNSQFTALLPVIPLFTCLLTNGRTGQVVCAALVLLIVLMLVFADSLPTNYGFDISQDNSTVKAFWLSMACLTSVFFGTQFDRLSTTLSQRLQHLATVDPLTNLLNRRSIIARFDYLIAKQKQQEWLSVLMIDVDNFKALNDNYGHLFGDMSLQAVAKVLDQSIRQDEDFVGRYGGEEFLILLEDVDPDTTFKIAEKIRKAVEGLAVKYESKVIPITITIGFCCLPLKEVNNLSHIVSLADEALYKGKAESKNCVIQAAQSEEVTNG